MTERSEPTGLFRLAFIRLFAPSSVLTEVRSHRDGFTILRGRFELSSRCAIAASPILPFATANAIFPSHLHWPARQNNVDHHNDHYSREANGESRCHLSTSPQYVVKQLIERPGNLTLNWQSSLTQLSGESHFVADFQQSRIKVLMPMVRTVDDHRAHFVLMQLRDSVTP